MAGYSGRQADGPGWPGSTSRGAQPWSAATTALLVALAIAACGGSSAPTDASVAQCLANEIDFGSCQKPAHVINVNANQTGNGLNMTTTPAVNATTVTCTHQQGNEYLCSASNGNSYQVTDDGTNISYQQAP